MNPGDLVSIARRVDPKREPGKLMLVARMGASVGKLQELMEAVATAGHPAIWLCDPMHANTLTSSDGRKTRYVSAIIAELEAFKHACDRSGVLSGGLHLETTIDDVRECLTDANDVRTGEDPFTSLCDPRLTLEQAEAVIKAWNGAAAHYAK